MLEGLLLLVLGFPREGSGEGMYVGWWLLMTLLVVHSAWKCVKKIAFLVRFLMSMVELAGEFKRINLAKCWGFLGLIHLCA